MEINIMKLLINSKLWRKMKDYDLDPTKKPTIFKNIENNNKTSNPTFTNSPEAFFNQMLETIRINLLNEFSNITDESFPLINKIDDIGQCDTGGEYVAQLVSDNGDYLSDIIIAYGDKAGNTLISQQVNQFILKKLNDEGDISYIYITRVFKKSYI